MKIVAVVHSTLWKFVELQYTYCLYLQNGLELTNLETLIKDSVRSFSHIYTQNLKYLRMRN